MSTTQVPLNQVNILQALQNLNDRPEDDLPVYLALVRVDWKAAHLALARRRMADTLVKLVETPFDFSTGPNVLVMGLALKILSMLPNRLFGSRLVGSDSPTTIVRQLLEVIDTSLDHPHLFFPYAEKPVHLACSSASNTTGRLYGLHTFLFEPVENLKLFAKITFKIWTWKEDRPLSWSSSQWDPLGRRAVNLLATLFKDDRGTTAFVEHCEDEALVRWNSVAVWAAGRGRILHNSIDSHAGDVWGLAFIVRVLQEKSDNFTTQLGDNRALKVLFPAVVRHTSPYVDHVQASAELIIAIYKTNLARLDDKECRKRMRKMLSHGILFLVRIGVTYYDVKSDLEKPKIVWKVFRLLTKLAQFEQTISPLRRALMELPHPSDYVPHIAWKTLEGTTKLFSNGLIFMPGGRGAGFCDNIYVGSHPFLEHYMISND